MSFEKFATEVNRTRNPALTMEQQASNWALGVTGEAGEVADIIKKHLYHGKPLDKVHLVEEMGDVLYYIQALCNMYGVSLEYVMTKNSDKLKKRFPNGFVKGNR